MIRIKNLTLILIINNNVLQVLLHFLKINLKLF